MKEFPEKKNIKSAPAPNDKLAALTFEDEKQRGILRLTLRDEPRQRVREFIRRQGTPRPLKNIERLRSFEKVGFLGDGDSIVGQNISLIKEKDKLVFTFKMEDAKWVKVMQEVKKNGDCFPDEITYKNKKLSHVLCRAVGLKIEGMTLKIADTATDIRSARGLVRIEIPGSAPFATEGLFPHVDMICKNVLGIERSLFIVPDPTTEDGEKLKQYAWSRKVDLEQPGSDLKSRRSEIMRAKKNLERKEVVSGHFALVEKGLSEKMMKTTPFLLYHNIYSNNTLVKVIESGALLSSHERYMRGMKMSGMSTSSDLRHGGADGVFLRLYADSDEGMDVSKFTNVSTFDNDRDVKLVFSPSVLDRTDCYCYADDEFGSTDPDTLEKRLTAEELILLQTKNGPIINAEIIFRAGISVADLKYIVATNFRHRSNIIRHLEKGGIQQINGKSVWDVVIVTDKPGAVLKKILAENYSSS